MKGKLITLLILLSLLLSLYIYKAQQRDILKTDQSKIVEDTKDSYKSLTYIITEVSGNDHYGQSIDGKTKIYFNSEDVKYPIGDSLNVNDKILAFMESENLVDGIVKIEKIQ